MHQGPEGTAVNEGLGEATCLVRGPWKRLLRVPHRADHRALQGRSPPARLGGVHGDDAREQPGTLAQVLLHETAVAWVRLQQTRTTPRQPWAETRAAFGERMRAIARRINEEYNVEALCREFPGRIQKLIDLDGDNLTK